MAFRGHSKLPDFADALTAHFLAKPSSLNTLSYKPWHFTAHGRAVCPRTRPDLR